MRQNLQEILTKIFNLKIFIVTLIIWAILNFSGIQNLFFTSGRIEHIVFFKGLHFIFLYSLFNIFYHIYKNRKNPKFKHGIIIFSIFCVILFIFLLLLWPGTFGWDDISILLVNQRYDLYAWQHFLTSLFQIMYLQTFPFASGIMIMQIIIIGLIVSYSVVGVANVFAKNEKQTILFEILLFIPMVLPPCIIYTLSGFRMGMYAFLEVLLISKVLVLYNTNKKINYIDFIILIILTTLVASWRTEGIYYLAFMPVLLLFFGKKYVSLKKIVCFFGICTILVLGINKINNHLIGNNNYTITAIIEPLQVLIKNADKEQDAKELSTINKILDLNMIYENPNLSGSQYYWSGIVKENYTKEEYRNLFVAYFKLMLKYPATTFKTMSDIFLKTTGVITDENGKSLQFCVVNDSIHLGDKTTSPGELWTKVHSVIKYPINNQLRVNTLRFLKGNNSQDKPTIIYYLIWNLLIPIFLILISLIYNLIRKNWFVAFVMMSIIIRVGILFMTSSLSYFMYYFPVYLLGYYIFMVAIIQLFKLKNKNVRMLKIFK